MKTNQETENSAAAISEKEFEKIGITQAENFDEQINLKADVRWIKLKDIIQPELPMRDKIDGQELNSLKESIKKVGLINPITVRYTKKGYEIIAGVRRFHAHKILMREQILSYVMDADEKDTITRRYAENMERASITVQEEAQYLIHLQKKFNLTQNEIAKTVGKSTAYVNERIQILSYPTQLYEALSRQEIDFSVARELFRIQDKDKMMQALEWAVRTGANARTVRIYREDINREIEIAGQDEEEYRGDTEPPTYQPEKIYVDCLLCKQKTDINQTQILRVCRSCFNQTI